MYDPESIQRLELLLQSDGKPPEPPIRTAVGLYDDNHWIDASVLPEPPWWFKFVDFFVRLEYVSVLRPIPLEFALTLLSDADIPPLYRLGLGLRWGFIDREQGFTVQDLSLILEESGLLKATIEQELDKIEMRSSYQLWRKGKPSLRDQLTRLIAATQQGPADL